MGGVQTHFASLCEHFCKNHLVKYTAIRTDGADPVIQQRLGPFQSVSFAELADWADVLHFDLYDNFERYYSKAVADKSIVTLINQRLTMPLARRLFKYRFPRIFTSMSQTIAESLKIPSQVIYSGVDTDRFRPLADIEKKYDVLIIGRMRPIKNHKLFIDICKKGNFSFLAIGGTATHFTGHMNEIERMVRDAATLGRDHVSGVVSDSELIELINQAHVAVVTSTTEGLGLNALEPMSCGLPVVAIDNGGSQEAIGEDKECGIVLPASSKLEGFVDAINNCMNNADMSVKARARVCSVFSMNKVFEEYSTLYHTITEATRN